MPAGDKSCSLNTGSGTSHICKRLIEHSVAWMNEFRMSFHLTSAGMVGGVGGKEGKGSIK